MHGEVVEFDRAGFTVTDKNKSSTVEAEWGADGVALVPLTFRHRSWEALEWGYGTWPAVPCHKWKGVTVADAGQGIVNLELGSCNLRGACWGPQPRRNAVGNVRECTLTLLFRALCSYSPVLSTSLPSYEVTF